MAARRPLTTIVAAAAASALVVGGVLVGTAPVSAAPAQSEACTTALEALEEEFGDVDLSFDDDLGPEVEAELEALFTAYEEAVVALYAQLGLDFYSDDDVYEVEEAAVEALDGLTEARAVAQTLLDEADADLAEADETLAEAIETGDDTAVTEAEEARELAFAAQQTALGARDDADAALAQAQDELDEIQSVISAIDDLDAEFEAALDELLGGLPEVDYDRLLELLLAVALECNTESGSEDSGSEDSGSDGTGGSGTGGGVAEAPVAQPVTGRASFTG